MTRLEETSPELLDALRLRLPASLGTETVDVAPYHTGGGCWVACIDLSQDGRGIGRQAWLTREEGWMLGFYDYAADEEDEGVCVQLLIAFMDSPAEVAGAVAGIFERLGVRLAGA